MQHHYLTGATPSPDAAAPVQPHDQPDRSPDQGGEGEAIFWEADPASWRFSFVSARAERLLGYPVSQWLTEDQFWTRHLHPADREWAAEECASAVADGRDHELEYRALGAHGDVFWIRDYVRVVKDDSGHPVQLQGVMVDVTARHQAEERAERMKEERDRQRRLLNAVLSQVPAQVWTAGPDGRLDYVNDRVQEYFGPSLDALLRQGWGQVVHPDDLARMQELWTRSLSTGEEFRAEFRLRQRGGDYRWHLARALPQRDADGRIQRWFGTSTDITEQVEAREQLAIAREVAERANRAKTAFLAGMSHDLRTPLTAIGGYASLVAEGLYGPATAGQRDAMDRIHRANQHLLALIEDVLGFAKIEAGAISLELEAVPVEEMLTGLEPLIEPQVAAKGLSYEYRTGPADVRVRADRKRVTQILVNLLTNALKFTDWGQVVVEWDATAADVRIHVHDSGRGIPPEQLATIFEPFVQAGSADDQTKGVGLGLTTSLSLARAMEGDLTVGSEVGRGSTFTLVLPRA